MKKEFTKIAFIIMLFIIGAIYIYKEVQNQKFQKCLERSDYSDTECEMCEKKYL